MPTRQLTVLGGHPTGATATTRKDRWWVSPLVTLVVLTGFSIYVTWAAFQGDNYYNMIPAGLAGGRDPTATTE